MNSLRWPRLWLALWLAGMAIGAYLSLRAGVLREPVIPHVDKLIHALSYGVLAVLACGLFAPGLMRTAAVLWLLVFGGLIELAQGAWAINRLADPWDLLANTCGIMAAVLLFRRRNVLQYIEKRLRK
ncbi:VanZ family protein [Arenimonas sp.]|uniref:VanZ family protein n=1 Tax=Arenimonas sp. TaxID=1872635 RepID=UPI0037BFD9E5